MLAVLCGLASGCSRPVHQGDVVYAFTWTPTVDADTPLLYSSANPSIDEWYASLDEDRCDPAVAKSAEL